MSNQPRITRWITARVENPDLEYESGESGPLRKVNEGRKIEFGRVVFGGSETLEGIMETLAIWVDRDVIEIVRSGGLEWSEVVGVVLRENRPAIREDFPDE